MKKLTHTPRHSLLILILMFVTLLGSLPGLSSVQAIDRDEARFAQASVQMSESGDYVNIRFHDRDRYKKPAGIYWLQDSSLNIFSNTEARDFWVHRLPSVLAGLIAVLGIYWAGLTLYNRRGAFIAALLLSSSLLFIFESHIAKTDAALCAASVWVLAAILRLRDPQYQPRHKVYAIILWAALGCAVIIKGPILPAILGTAFLSVTLWEKFSNTYTSWLRRLISPLGLCLFGLICLPWYIMIGKYTGGEFFGIAIGGDLAPKLAGSQEKHGGPPGYYALSIFATFWPAALFLLAGLAYGLKAIKSKMDTPLGQAPAAWLLSWIIPFWIILELVPTKLTHYALPLFPALALLMAGAILSIEKDGGFIKTRRIGAVIFLIITIVLIFVIAGADTLYGTGASWVYLLGIIILAAAFYTAMSVFRGKMKPALIGLVITGLGLSSPTYGFIMPQLTDFRLANRIGETLAEKNIPLPRQGGPLIRSPHFTQPSLIYNLGTHILLGRKADDYKNYPLHLGHIWIIDMKKSDSQSRVKNLQNIAATNKLCMAEYGQVKGFDYEKGDEVELIILSTQPCEAEAG